MKDFFHNIQLKYKFTIFYLSNFAEWFFNYRVQRSGALRWWRFRSSKLSTRKKVRQLHKDRIKLSAATNAKHLLWAVAI